MTDKKPKVISEYTKLLELEDLDEGFHETSSDKEMLLNENKKKVQFRNVATEPELQESSEPASD